jgi:Flp pilus assembly protein TadG
MVIMIALLIGGFQMFAALYVYHYVSYAAREASRYAIVRGNECSGTGMPNCPDATPAQIQTYVEDLGFPGINSNDMTVNTTWLTASATQPETWTACGTTNACQAPGNQVKVQVIYSFPLRIPFVKNQTLNIASTSALVVSQ